MKLALLYVWGVRGGTMSGLSLITGDKGKKEKGKGKKTTRKCRVSKLAKKGKKTTGSKTWRRKSRQDIYIGYIQSRKSH